MRRPLFALNLLAPLAALTLATPAQAGGGAPLPHATYDVGAARWLAAADVRAMASTTLDGVLHRAIVSDRDGEPALVIETFEHPGQRDRPTTQTVIDGFRLRDRVRAFADVATAIEGLELHRRTLTFETRLRGRDATLRCTLELGATQALCQGAEVEPRPRPGHPPFVAPTNWAAQPAVIQACGDALYASEAEGACLERVRSFAFDPTAAIRACDTHAYGDDGTLACLAGVSAARLDPTATIAACDAATYGQDAFLQCLTAAQAFRFPAASTIAACDRAMYGDAATVQCVAAASRYAYDASPTVAACDAAMYGDEAVLACVQRGGAY